jgi:RNA polymerase-binding transcription factor DksA
VDAVIARKRLEELRDSLDRSISVLGGSNSRHGGLAAEYPQDPADAGAHLSETERAAAMLDAARRQRSQVMVALGRIEQGTYGLCADCGGPVPEGRLEAKPDAARCVPCQAKHDRRRR